MHPSKVSISEYGCDPQLLGVHISTHKDIARGSLHHGLQLTAYPVRLQEEWGQDHPGAQGNCYPRFLGPALTKYLVSFLREDFGECHSPDPAGK